MMNNINWTVHELRTFLEELEQEGEGNKIIRFQIGEKVYQLDWPVCFTNDTIQKISKTSLDGEVVEKSTIDLLLERDYSSLQEGNNEYYLLGDESETKGRTIQFKVTPKTSFWVMNQKQKGEENAEVSTRDI